MGREGSHDVLTMSFDLQVLISKAKLAAEEALRLLLFALNGLAALYVIDKDLTSAIERYREVNLKLCCCCLPDQPHTSFKLSYEVNPHSRQLFYFKYMMYQ